MEALVCILFQEKVERWHVGKEKKSIKILTQAWIAFFKAATQVSGLGTGCTLRIQVLLLVWETIC